LNANCAPRTLFVEHASLSIIPNISTKFLMDFRGKKILGLWFFFLSRFSFAWSFEMGAFFWFLVEGRGEKISINKTFFLSFGEEGRSISDFFVEWFAHSKKNCWVVRPLQKGKKLFSLKGGLKKSLYSYSIFSLILFAGNITKSKVGSDGVFENGNQKVHWFDFSRYSLLRIWTENEVCLYVKGFSSLRLFFRVQSL